MKGCFSTASYLWVICLKHIQYDFDDLAFIGKYISIPKGTKKYIHVDYNTYGPPGEKYPDIVETRNNIFEGDLIVDDGVVYSSDKSILYRFPYWLDREEYRVDEKCKIIEEAAFDDNTEIDEWGQHIRFNKLKTLFLPNGLEEIKDYAFVGCGHIENLTIPLSVKKIGNYVFGQCVSLITLTFISRIDTIGEKAFHIGKTMPGSLVSPYEPYVSLAWEKNEVDIIVCPKDTDVYYKKILDNNNSLFFQIDKDEKQIEIENPNCIYDIDYLFVKTSETPLILKKNFEDIFCVEWYGGGYGVNLSILKKFLGGLVFDVFRPSNRFSLSPVFSGICYVTYNYRARFISDSVRFASFNDAIDFLCRVYFDINDHELDWDI